MKDSNLIESINKLIEEIGSLEVQKENLLNEYNQMQSFLESDFRENFEHALEKGKNKRRMIIGIAVVLTFAFCVGILLFFASLTNENLSNAFAWFNEFIRAIEAGSVFEWLVLGAGGVSVSFIVGNHIKNSLENRTKREVKEQLDDKNANLEISELERIMKKVDREIAIHKKELKEFRKQLFDIQTSDEIQEQAMMQYYQEMEDAVFFKTNVEMDIAKNPYTK